MKTNLFQRLFCKKLLYELETKQASLTGLKEHFTSVELNLRNEVRLLKRELEMEKVESEKALKNQKEEAIKHLHSQLEQQRQAHKQERLMLEEQRINVATHLTNEIEKLKKENEELRQG